MPAAMEVDHWLQSNLGLDILLLGSGSQLLGCSIEAVYICLMVILVVKLHYLARDCWLERSIVVCEF